MKITAIVLSLAALLALSGCNNLSTPESTVASAYSDVQKGDLSHFQDTLSGNALAAYGTEAGMKSLQQKLAGTDPQISDAEELSSVHNPYSESWTETYDVKVVSGDQSAHPGVLLQDLTVICETTENDTNPSCIGGNPENYPGCLPPGEQNYTSYCAIDSVK